MHLGPACIRSTVAGRAQQPTASSPPCCSMLSPATTSPPWSSSQQLTRTQDKRPKLTCTDAAMVTINSKLAVSMGAEAEKGRTVASRQCGCLQPHSNSRQATGAGGSDPQPPRGRVLGAGRRGRGHDRGRK